jgi:hypothetical protein
VVAFPGTGAGDVAPESTDTASCVAAAVDSGVEAFDEPAFDDWGALDVGEGAAVSETGGGDVADASGAPMDVP